MTCVGQNIAKFYRTLPLLLNGTSKGKQEIMKQLSFFAKVSVSPKLYFILCITNNK